MLKLKTKVGLVKDDRAEIYIGAWTLVFCLRNNDIKLAIQYPETRIPKNVLEQARAQAKAILLGVKKCNLKHPVE